MADSPKKFAKLFDTDEGQFLVTLSETDDGERAIKCRAADIEGITVEITLSGWEDDYGQEKAFDIFDQAAAEESARRFRNIVREQVSA